MNMERTNRMSLVILVGRDGRDARATATMPMLGPTPFMTPGLAPTSMAPGVSPFAQGVAPGISPFAKGVAPGISPFAQGVAPGISPFAKGVAPGISPFAKGVSPLQGVTPFFGRC